eukprot:SAG11_NODE_44_length_20765_cov_5.183635_15_plen_51_part_00
MEFQLHWADDATIKPLEEHEIQLLQALTATEATLVRYALPGSGTPERSDR